MNEKEQQSTALGDLWIPAELANNATLTWGAKSLYSVLRNLIVGSKLDYCYPGNGWLGKIFGVSGRTISAWLAELEIAGCIRRSSELYNGSYQRRIRLAYIFLRDPMKKSSCPPEKNFRHNTKEKNNNKLNPPLKSPQGDNAENSSTETAPATEKSGKSGAVRRRRKEKTPADWEKLGYTPFGHFGNIWLTYAEYDALVSEHGQIIINDELEQLSGWLARDNKTCENYAAALTDFVLRHKAQNNGKLDQDYKQREYSKEELQSLFDDLDTVSV